LIAKESLVPRIQHPNIRNALLASLPEQDMAALRPKLRRVRLPFKQVLFGPEQPIEALYFFESGLTSILASLADGSRVEVALIGWEGVAGVDCMLGTRTPGFEAMVQLEASALALSISDAQDAFDERIAFRRSLLRFAQAQYSLAAQTAACIGRHELVRRLACWILFVHDRIDGDRVAMTHEFISLMLGVRRSGVTLAVKTLEKAGAIRQGNGHVDVVDREALEAASCECYGVVCTQYKELLAA
jgi:CRP-like cAMP-binding protein